MKIRFAECEWLEDVPQFEIIIESVEEKLLLKHFIRFGGNKEWELQAYNTVHDKMVNIGYVKPGGEPSTHPSMIHDGRAMTKIKKGEA